MKTLYKLLFILCLLAGASCALNTEEAEVTVENQETQAAETDTTEANDDVPESLMHH